MNWLVVLVSILAVGPIGAVGWWWLRSKRAEERKVYAVSKMDRYLSRRRAEGQLPGPRHALPEGFVPERPVFRLPAAPAAGWPAIDLDFAPPASDQVPALSMPAPPPHWHPTRR